MPSWNIQFNIYFQFDREETTGDSPVKLNRKKANKNRILDDSSDEEHDVDKENGKNKANTKDATKSTAETTEINDKDDNSKKSKDPIPPKRKTGKFPFLLSLPNIFFLESMLYKLQTRFFIKVLIYPMGIFLLIVTIKSVWYLVASSLLAMNQ